MTENENNMALRSEKVQAIVGRIPPALLRYGTLAIIGTLILLVSIAFWLPYRSVYTGQVTFYGVPNGRVEVKMTFDGNRTPKAIAERRPLVTINEKDINLTASLLSLSSTRDTLQRYSATLELKRSEERIGLLANQTFSFTIIDEHGTVIDKMLGR